MVQPERGHNQKGDHGECDINWKPPLDCQKGTFSPVQDGCVQLRMDGYLQANETSTDKMS